MLIIKMTTETKINNIQRNFILKAISDKESLYNFEDTTEKEFKLNYGFSKKMLIKEIEKLKEVLTK